MQIRINIFSHKIWSNLYFIVTNWNNQHSKSSVFFLLVILETFLILWPFPNQDALQLLLQFRTRMKDCQDNLICKIYLNSVAQNGGGWEGRIGLSLSNTYLTGGGSSMGGWALPSQNQCQKACNEWGMCEIPMLDHGSTGLGIQFRVSQSGWGKKALICLVVCGASKKFKNSSNGKTASCTLVKEICSLPATSVRAWNHMLLLQWFTCIYYNIQ